MFFFDGAHFPCLRAADKIKLGTYLSDERVKKGVKGEEKYVDVRALSSPCDGSP